MIKGTTADQNLSLALSKTGEAARIVTYADAIELYNAFRSGAVGCIARDGALLANFQQALSSETNPIETTMLNGQLSYEPIAAVVDENQSKFLDLVNAVIAILKQAAELGVTSTNANERWTEAIEANGSEPLRHLFQLNADAALPSIGITPDRIKSILLAVGNIDEISQRFIPNSDQNTLPTKRQIHRSL